MVIFAKKNLVLVIFATFLFFLTPTVANAYIDPGSGSFIIQAILAFLLGVGYVVKVYWRKIKNIFSKRSTEPDKNGKE